MTYSEFKELRKETGLTQAAFAKEIGVSVDTVRSWERPTGGNKIKPMAEKVILDTYKRLTKVV